MRVLAVVSHPDDEVLGPGATLAKHVLAGDDVRVLILGKGRPDARSDAAARRAGSVIGFAPLVFNLPDNQFDTVSLLGIAQLVEAEMANGFPDVIYTHSADDLNVDHRLTHQAVLSASRPQPGCSVKRILAFEVPSSTEWGLEAFWPNVFVDVSGEPMRRKRRALECYASEMRPSPHPRSYAAVNALALWRGATAGIPMAEAFRLVREIR